MVQRTGLFDGQHRRRTGRAVDPVSRQYTAAYLDRITRAFRNALENGSEAGDIDVHADLGELTAFLTTALIGVAACFRSEAPPAQLHAAGKVVMTTLDQHRPANHA